MAVLFLFIILSIHHIPLRRAFDNSTLETFLREDLSRASKGLIKTYRAVKLVDQLRQCGAKLIDRAASMSEVLPSLITA